MAKNSMRLSVGRQSILLVILLLLIDQIVKILVKTNMCLGEYIRVTDWCYIHFVENNGMAYGMTFLNKLFLSSLRIVVVCLLVYYIFRLIQRQASRAYILLLSAIVAGAAGNIIDSIFYGLIFTESTVNNVATFTHFGSGYAPCLMGRVVDMFYFPLFHFTWPDWMPIVGGEDHIFFSPIFNFADACISVSVVLLFIFCRKDLSNTNNDKQKS